VLLMVVRGRGWIRITRHDDQLATN